ncbi:MAG: FecR family protein [Odoribacter sp.]
MKTNEELPDILSELIYKNFLDLLHKDEQEELQRLCKQYKVTLPEREQVIWALEHTDEFDNKTAYHQFVATTHRRMIPVWWRIAVAVVLLLTGAATFYMLRTPSERLAEWTVAKKIEAGSRKAVITLTTGERIDLDVYTQGLQETDGTQIWVDSGKLLYRAADKSGEVMYNKIEIPRGGEYQLVLADGTEVWLNAETELRFPVHFVGDRREVFLKGEAYFKVAKNEAQPFIVCTSNGQIQVMGTSFNVRDYAEEGKVVTTLVEGKVDYVSERYKRVSLQPGYMLEDNGSKDYRIRKVNTLEYTGWKDGKYIFENASVEEIMTTLERWYDVTVFYRNEEVRNLHFTGDLERYASINTLLNFMEMGGDVRFEINGNTIMVGKK